MRYIREYKEIEWEEEEFEPNDIPDKFKGNKDFYKFFSKK